MTIFVMLEQSAVLTVLGMGVVFGFLIIMVLCVSAMGKIIQGLVKNSGAEAPEAAPVFVQAGTVDPGKSTAVTAAISAAVTQYQKDNS
jgi:oxaloacetate decarboxylase gamma subunit